MGSEHYCLRWNNHQSNLLGVFSQLLQDESLVDVTLACAEGHSIRAHKVVLSACSSYFQTLFVDHPTRHPIVILKDVRFAELRTLVEFMYKGEVNVEYCQLSALLKTAESLKVKGLAEMTNLNSTRDDRSEGQQQKHTSSTATVSASDTPMTPELVTKRPLNDDVKTPPPGGSISPPPPPAKRASRGHQDSLCEDNESCDEGGGGGRSNTPEADDLSSSVRGGCAGPSDMSISNSATSCNPPAPAATATCSASTSRLPSPHSSEPMPGPSGMLPVQQVPLSLKKEVDWDRSVGDDKSTTGESSSDYRHSHDTEAAAAAAAMAAATAAALEGRFGPACAVAAARRRCSAELQISTRASTPFQFPFSPFAGGYPTTFGDPNDAAVPGCSILGLLQRQGLLAAAASPLSDDSGRSSTGPAAATFRCPICLAAFPSAWLLEQHSTLQHAAPVPGPGGGSDDGGGGSSGTAPGDEEKPFKCEQCGQSYRYRSAYLKHREQNHRARLPADKLFTCDVCGMQFRYLKSFKKHRLNHALEKLHSKSPADLDVFARAVRGGGSPSIFGERPFRPSSTGQPESTSDYGGSRDSPFSLITGSGSRLNGDASGLFSPPPSLLSARDSVRLTMPSSATAAAAAAAAAASPSAASSSSAADGGSDQVSSSNEAVGSNASDSGVSAGLERTASVPVVKSEQQNFYKFSVDDYYYSGMERKGMKTERASDSEQDETIDSLAFALSVQASVAPANLSSLENRATARSPPPQ